MTDQSKSK